MSAVKEKKLSTSALPSTSTSAGKKRKCSGGGTGATPVSEQSAGPPAKKQLTVSQAGTTGGGGKARIPRFTKDEISIALKGVQPTLWEAREKRDLAEDVPLLVRSGYSVSRKSHFLRRGNQARRPKRKPLRRLQRLQLLVRRRKRRLFTW